VALSWLMIMETLVKKNVVSSPVSRKLVHIVTGPLFMLCWYFYSDSPNARYFAAVLPGALTTRFGLLGLGIIKDEKTVRSMSRTGDRRELLLGPLAYGIIFVISTIVYWRESIKGVTALMLLCAGDGAAGLIGGKWGKPFPLPHNRKKSWIGTLAFVLFSFVGILIYVRLFAHWGWLTHTSVTTFGPHLMVMVLIAALIESLPLEDWDNVTVFLASIGAYYILGY